VKYEVLSVFSEIARWQKWWTV